MRGAASALVPRVWKQVREPSTALLVTQLISIAFRLASNLVLAHLLVPRDFGMLTITTLVATALAMMSETGAWVSIVRKGDSITRDWVDQMWTLHVIRGVMLWFAALALTPAVAAAYGEPQLLWLLPVANVWLVIEGFASVYPRVRNNDLKPGLHLKLQMLSQVVGSVVSIIGAIIYPSPWALIGGLLAGAAASAFMGHFWACRPLPRVRLTRVFLREQWEIAKWLIVSTGLGFFAGQIDKLIFPAWFGTVEFGVYSVALTLALFPLQLGQKWADMLYMPAIAKLSRDHSSGAERQLRHLCRTVVTYAAVASALLGGLGPPFFHALYPERFAAAGTFIQILAVTSYATFVTYLHRRTFLYQGMTRLEASIEASRLALFLLALGATAATGLRISAVDYVAVYAGVQVAVYSGLLVVGRFRNLVHIRDDLPGHALFVAIAVGLTMVDKWVEQFCGPTAALMLGGLIGGCIALVTVARLGLPELPTGKRSTAPLDEDLADAPENLDAVGQG